jgi:hypothetical protein
MHPGKFKSLVVRNVGLVILRGNNPQDRMSALGQKQTFTYLWPMSALPPKADIKLARATSGAARPQLRDAATVRVARPAFLLRVTIQSRLRLTAVGIDRQEGEPG